jgi:hypothetical protein
VIRVGFDIAIAFAACATRREGRNKDGAPHLSWRTAILSPSPRAWPFNVGRSRYADRLRPNFLLKPSDRANAPQPRCELLADPTGIGKITLTASQRRLALAWLAFALARFTAEKQRLADNGRDHGDLERFCDQERWLRALSG